MLLNTYCFSCITLFYHLQDFAWLPLHVPPLGQNIHVDGDICFWHTGRVLFVDVHGVMWGLGKGWRYDSCQWNVKNKILPFQQMTLKITHWHLCFLSHTKWNFNSLDTTSVIMHEWHYLQLESGTGDWLVEPQHPVPAYKLVRLSFKQGSAVSRDVWGKKIYIWLALVK